MRAFAPLLHYMRPYRAAAILAPLLMALEVAMDLAQPRLLQVIVDDGIAAGDLALVLRVGAIMLGAGVVGLIGGGGCTVYAAIAGYGFGTDIRHALFASVQRLSFGNLDRLSTGRLITNLTSDVDQVQEAAITSLRILVRAPLLMVGGLVMAVLTDPPLSLLLVAISPFIVLTLVVASRRGHDLFLAVQARMDRLNAVIQENLSGVRLVKAFLRAPHECERFGAANDQLRAGATSAGSLVAGVPPVLMLFVNLGVVGVIWFGGLQVQAGRVHVGQLLAFINYLVQMLSSLMMVGMLAMRMAQAGASAERITAVLEAEPDVRDLPGAAPGEPSRGRVEFDGVELRYDGEDTAPCLRHVSFVAEPGQSVALLGATGAGKSSLVHLVPRFYDASAGRVLVDGADVRAMRQGDLRRGIGVVLQNTVLFSGTIRDNIRYGRPDATQGEVEEAARMAQAHEFVSAMPDGYDSLLGQKGVNLSGGQRQRLAIARALLCRPAVLILDDCTSAVDADTEARITRALASLPEPCTRLVVAQRISAVLSADKILVLEDGAIAAEGTHRELLASSPLYAEIVRSQLDEEAASDG